MDEERHPISGIDYPGIFQEFDEWFSSEHACLEYIAKLRWQNGFTCPGFGIHQGAIRPSHLDYYLDEFTFWFNRRTSNARGLLFYRLIEQAVHCPPVPRKMLIGGKTQNVLVE